MESKLDSKLGLFELTLEKNIKEELQSTYDGGINRSFYVKAKLKASHQWLKARIIASRLSASTSLKRKFQWNFLPFCLSFNLDFVASMPKTPEAYEYYVHFENIDKRNDCWLPAQDIHQTKDPILEEKKS